MSLELWVYINNCNHGRCADSRPLLALYYRTRFACKGNQSTMAFTPSSSTFSFLFLSLSESFHLRPIERTRSRDSKVASQLWERRNPFLPIVTKAKRQLFVYNLILLKALWAGGSTWQRHRSSSDTIVLELRLAFNWAAPPFSTNRGPIGPDRSRRRCDGLARCWPLQDIHATQVVQP